MFEEPVRRLAIGSSEYGLFYPVEPRGIMLHAFTQLSRDPRAQMGNPPRGSV
jgi:hypothetical protein